MIKNIYIYWNSGWNNAPEVAKICLEQWSKKNPTWKVFCLDDENITDYLCIPDVRHKMKIQAWSDVLRIYLLFKYGGLWVDASCYCNKPLDSWLHNNVESGFFAFSNPARSRKIASWFMYADRGNEIVSSVYDMLNVYWNSFSGGSYPYFWLHEIFNNYFEKNSDKFYSMSKIDCFVDCNDDNPHRFVPYQKSFGSITYGDYDAYDSYVYKLNCFLPLANRSSVRKMINNTKF